MNFRVEVTDEAVDDLRRIHNWIAKRSPQGAATWMQAAQDSVDRLEIDALLYSLDPRGQRIGVSFRICPFSTPHGRTYQILFLIDDAHAIVQVLRIRSPGQRPVRRRDLN
jgi:plasmid stabilization system protein ParE